MDNPTFVDEEDIPLVHQENDEDYDDYNTPDTSRIDDTSFTVPDTTEVTKTLLRQKLKRDKIVSLYRYLDVTGDPDLIDLDRFRLTKDSKKGVTIFAFYNGYRWVPLTNQAGDFLAPKTLIIDVFGGGSEGAGGSPSDTGPLKKWLDRLADALKRQGRSSTKVVRRGAGGEGRGEGNVSKKCLADGEKF